MLKIERINVLAIIGSIATWGAILYYTFRPDKYSSDVVHPDMNTHNRNARLVYLFLHTLHDYIGKTGLFVLLGIVGSACVYYSFRFQKNSKK